MSTRLIKIGTHWSEVVEVSKITIPTIVIFSCDGDVHKVVHENLVRANSKYKQDADHKQRHVDFEEGDFVLAILTKDRFPVGEYNKLSAKKIGPLEINMVPYHGDSSDDDLAMNSRMNFVYPGEGGMMEA
ncbi:hypothetical protein Tco_0323525 [Tanacetum coccineum]